MVENMDKKLIEITEAEAKEEYCNGRNVYVSNDKRNYWKIPSSYEYGSHAPAEELFNRSVPKYEGENTFYK